MKNTITDLNNHLFEQMERLNDETLTGERLEEELRRADGMSRIAGQIIQNGELVFKAMKYADDYGYGNPERRLPQMLELK